MGQGLLPCFPHPWYGKTNGVFRNAKSTRRQRAQARHTCSGGYVTVAKCATAMPGNDRCFDLSYRADCFGYPRSAHEHFYFSAGASQTTPNSLEQRPNLTLPFIPRMARKTKRAWLGRCSWDGQAPLAVASNSRPLDLLDVRGILPSP
jgi:hypothetical protein